MRVVDICPKNKSEVDEKSTRLGCGSDVYGNNRYMCLPSADKTSLVEFCYDGVMGIEYKGNCLETLNGQVIRKDCSSFQFGCPDVHFWKYDFYKFPACQCINVQDQCYRLDLSCKPGKNITHDINNSANIDAVNDDSIYIYTLLVCALVILSIILFVICIVLAYMLRRKHGEVSREKNPVRIKPENTEDNSFGENNTECVSPLLGINIRPDPGLSMYSTGT